MKRRDFLKTAGASALALILPKFSFGAEILKRPNILLIITDQQFADAMSCRMGDKYLKTPNMDSLAKGGMIFTLAYTSNPLCMPSRASMFTGRYPIETGQQTNNSQLRLDPAKFPCLGTIFKNAGYHTGYSGKWHLPFTDKDKSQHGFEYVANPRFKNDDTWAQGAVAFLKKVERTKPFLLVASFRNPHNICEWPRGEELPDGPIGDPPDPKGAPPAPDQCPPSLVNHKVPKGEMDGVELMRRSRMMSPQFPVWDFDENKWRQYLWVYYRLIERVDGHIGLVLQALREIGQEKNTLIIFVSDHGDCHGAHRLSQKTVFYDESARVPYIIHYEGVTKSGTSDRLVNTGIDTLPTLCDYAGIPIPEGLPGLSLKETANGATPGDPREYIVSSNQMTGVNPVDGVVPTLNGRMMRSRRYKYCAYVEGKRRESLVDMETDSGEMVNLAEDPKYKEILDQHRKILADWCRKYQDSFPVPGRS